MTRAAGTWLALVLVAGLCLAPAGCGGGTSFVRQARTGVDQVHDATNRARDLFLRWNKAAEAGIVAGAETLAERDAGLATLDKARAPVLAGLTAVYTALSHAEALLALAEAGKADKAALVVVLVELAEAADELQVAARALGIDR